MRTYRITERDCDTDDLIRIVADELTFDDAKLIEHESVPEGGHYIRMERFHAEEESWEYL